MPGSPRHVQAMKTLHFKALDAETLRK